MADAPPYEAEVTEETSGGSKKKLAILLAAVAVIGAGFTFYALSGDKQTPAERLGRALELIDQRESNWKIRQSLEIVDELDELQYVDPNFPSAMSYIRGIAEFYTGREFEGREQQQRYLKAIEHFEKAFPRGMPPHRKAEMTWAMGVALQVVSLPTRARETLEMSLEDYPQGRVEASLLLMQNYSDQQLAGGLERALAISDGLAAMNDLTDQQKEKADYLRTRILGQMGRLAEAAQVLSQIESRTSQDHKSIIERAHIMMSEGQSLAENQNIEAANRKYSDAQAMLQPLIDQNGHTEFAARASFLNALCSERLLNVKSAINYYQQTARRFSETDEWAASQLRLASLLREEGRDEESLRAYREVLRAVVRPEDFRNRWLATNQFRDAILLAWNDWLKDRKFDRAMDLTRVMSPLIERVRTLELIAQTSEQWAEAAQSALDDAPFGRKRELRPKSKELWVQSGKAHRDLAAGKLTGQGYPESVWTSAQHFERGGAFEEALAQADEFIRVDPPRGIPRARVFRGRMLMNLDRLSEAYESFQNVELNSPTDPSVFEARYLLGMCQLEMDRPQDAGRTWQAMLTSEELEPAANEWRLSKFALGHLTAHLASNAYRKSTPAEGAEPTEEQSKLRQDAYDYWKEAIRHLDEYLKRYPESDERIAARYLFAGALQSSVAEIREELFDAMPVNARAELFREISQVLSRAGDEYRILQRQLQDLRVANQLDDYGQELYRTTFLTIPQTLFEQERYADALSGFRTVTSRFPDHVSALTAYVLMARCHSRLGEPDEARLQFEQARVVLGRLSDEAFASPSTGMTREQWRAWIEWARQIHDSQNQKVATSS